MITVTHADAALIVADKPAGLLAVPGRGPDKQDCLSARIQAIYPDALIVHRLDMDTSGLMCFARGAKAQRTLSIAFAERRTQKRYVALVEGNLPLRQDWQLIDLPLLLDWPNRPRSKVDHLHGKPSQTRWRAIAYDADKAATRVELMPISGRSHQLRVHMLAIGHPIVGDPFYGTQATRMYLHATELTLPHPSHDHDMTFFSDAPF
ncbi:MAG: RluA family pseudouridine synthase [Rhodocyclaceae bacterium]|jgi:tRNA pseudouridine32 synthase/23S rRNA pseudouridine746 synthase|nr:RluA family pseudouridine synthase [Rhodocyclaceae bacterium]